MAVSKELLRFCTVGVFATLFHYGVYLLLLYLDAGVSIAYTIGYLLSWLANFFLTSYFTFSTTPNIKRLTGFAVSHLVNYLLHMCLLRLCLYIGVGEVIAPFFVYAVAVPVNFLMVRYVFKR